MRKWRIAYLVSHPIQYQAPLLRCIATQPDVELKVFFCSDFSAQEFSDPEFRRVVKWDVPLLEGYQYEFLPCLGRSQSIGWFRPFIYGLNRHLRSGQFDVLWVHGWVHWSHVWAVCLAKRLGIKVLLRGEANLCQPPGNALKQAVKRRFLSWLFSRVDAFLAIGSWNRDFYLHYKVEPERIFLMPYAVDNRFFQAKTQEASTCREEFRRSLDLQPGRPIILFASKLIERKRPHHLLEAYRRLSADGRSEPQAYLLFVGEGEMRAALERHVKVMGWRSIRFLGFKNQSELPAFYDLCDIFVLPSVKEPWGLVVNEAMNAGKAVIVSDEVGSGADLVRNDVNGFIFRAGDIVALHWSLARALTDLNYQRMGQASREFIDAWSFHECVAGLRQALTSVAERR